MFFLPFGFQTPPDASPWDDPSTRDDDLWGPNGRVQWEYEAEMLVRERGEGEFQTRPGGGEAPPSPTSAPSFPAPQGDPAKTDLSALMSIPPPPPPPGTKAASLLVRGRGRGRSSRTTKQTAPRTRPQRNLAWYDEEDVAANRAVWVGARARAATAGARAMSAPTRLELRTHPESGTAAAMDGRIDGTAVRFRSTAEKHAALLETHQAGLLRLSGAGTRLGAGPPPGAGGDCRRGYDTPAREWWMGRRALMGEEKRHRRIEPRAVAAGAGEGVAAAWPEARSFHDTDGWDDDVVVHHASQALTPSPAVSRSRAGPSPSSVSHPVAHASDSDNNNGLATSEVDSGSSDEDLDIASDSTLSTLSHAKGKRLLRRPRAPPYPALPTAACAAWNVSPRSLDSPGDSPRDRHEQDAFSQYFGVEFAINGFGKLMRQAVNIDSKAMSGRRAIDAAIDAEFWPTKKLVHPAAWGARQGTEQDKAATARARARAYSAALEAKRRRGRVGGPGDDVAATFNTVKSGNISSFDVGENRRGSTVGRRVRLPQRSSEEDPEETIPRGESIGDILMAAAQLRLKDHAMKLRRGAVSREKSKLKSPYVDRNTAAKIMKKTRDAEAACRRKGATVATFRRAAMQRGLKAVPSPSEAVIPFASAPTAAAKAAELVAAAVSDAEAAAVMSKAVDDTSSLTTRESSKMDMKDRASEKDAYAARTPTAPESCGADVVGRSDDEGSNPEFLEVEGMRILELMWNTVRDPTEVPFTIGNLEALARSGTKKALERIKMWCRLVGIEVSGDRGSIYDGMHYVEKLKSKYQATVAAMDKYVPVGQCTSTLTNQPLNEST